ncbi:hypothetical protein AT292_09425 [Enterobacter cloacae]|nr:hypothetical protein AT292_09425 [Enterobacter cloacae]
MQGGNGNVDKGNGRHDQPPDNNAVLQVALDLSGQPASASGLRRFNAWQVRKGRFAGEPAQEGKRTGAGQRTTGETAQAGNNRLRMVHGIHLLT